MVRKEEEEEEEEEEGEEEDLVRIGILSAVIEIKNIHHTMKLYTKGYNVLGFIFSRAKTPQPRHIGFIVCLFVYMRLQIYMQKCTLHIVCSSK